MFKFLKFISFCLLLMSAVSGQAQQLRVDSLRYWSAPERTRMVFDVDAPAAHQVFLLANPARLVIDFKDATLARPLSQPSKNHRVFSRIRSGFRNKKDLRVVVDLKATVTPTSFLLPPDKSHGHRLVVDLLAKNKSIKAVNNTSATPSKVVTKTVINKARDIIVAVDAGHGGTDPGAKGRMGTKEKDVVFAIAKKLAALIDEKPGMKAVLVRKDDTKIELKKRMKIARAAKADLFISIHADAFNNSNANGASVFTLSNKGASSVAAKWLAQRENAADLVGGVNLADKGDDVATVLMDLSQTATKEVSKNVAGNILKNFKTIGHLHKNRVQKARFIVLKAPDIPSVLVETAFISNPAEERKLRSAKHQAKMARAIFNGVVGYFEENAPADTYFALNSNQTHTISRGETLSGIAQQYGVSMGLIKSVNELASNQVQVGQVLNIPRG